MGTNTILLIVLIACILFYNYIGLYISRKYGAKVPSWPSIIKSKDYTFYLIYFCSIPLLLNGIISILNDNYILPLVLLGFAFMLTGMYINFIARRDLGKRWSPLADSKKDQSLIKTGIYTKVRHPIYLSILVFWLGIALIGGNFFSLLYVLFLVALKARIRKEESELITRFGEEYKEYIKGTPMLIPKLRTK